MDSIGNDIIDLEYIDACKTKDPRFFLKIISNSEQALHQKSNLSFETFLWLLWSIKESVYKCQKRVLPGLLFSPLKINIRDLHRVNNYEEPDLRNRVCEQTGIHGLCWSAEISSCSGNFYSRSVINSRFIFTLVQTDKTFNGIFWGIKYVDDTCYDYQSRQVRDFVVKRFQKIYSNETLKIEKDPIGFPILFKNSSLTAIPISFSHHYHFVSYSFLRESVTNNIL